MCESLTGESDGFKHKVTPHTGLDDREQQLEEVSDLINPVFSSVVDHAQTSP